MKGWICSVSVALAVGSVFAIAAQAHLTAGPDVIAPPASVVNSNTAGGATNDHQQGFDERSRVTLSDDLAVDGGSIPAGTTVDSHMVFLNVPDGTPGATTDFNRTWTFDAPVLGVMSDSSGALEVASSPMLGAPATTYPMSSFANRGLDLPAGSLARGAGGISDEGYTIDGDTITVGMTVSQPGDWIRVVTQSAHVACTSATAGPVAVWPPNHTLRTVTIGGVSNVEITGVTQDEPIEGTGDGDASPDAAAGTAPGTVSLRAERSGTGDGRVYTIGFTGVSTDGPCSGTVTVSVPQSQSKPAVDSAPPSYDSFGP